MIKSLLFARFIIDGVDGGGRGAAMGCVNCVRL